MFWVAFFVILLSLVNVFVGLYLNRRESISLGLRTVCHFSSVIQLFGLCFLMYFREDSEFFVLMIAIVFFFFGYYLIVSPRFLKIKH